MTLPDDLAEQIKYHAARAIWRKRDAYTPGKNITWRAWFKRRFGEDLNDYARRKAREN